MGQGLEGERVGVEKEDLGELRQAEDVKLGEDESEVLSTCRTAKGRQEMVSHLEWLVDWQLDLDAGQFERD